MAVLWLVGGMLLFSLLEEFTYMQAFYYCFISVTTVG